MAIQSAYCQPVRPLASEIASMDLAIANEDQFTQKLTSLIDESGRLLLKTANASNKQRAGRLYNSLDVLTNIYIERYPIKTALLDEAKSLMADLSTKFKLVSPNFYIIPIAEGKESVPIGTRSIQEFFEFAAKDKTLPFTQTEAYLTKPELKKTLLESEAFTEDSSPLRENSGKLNELLARTLNQERIHRDYYVLYHAQNKKFILFYDILKELIKQTLKKEHTAFEYLRVPGPATYNKKLAEIVKKGFEWDHDPEVKKMLLSVNLSLFGNASVTTGESSFSALLFDRSILPPERLFELIFDSFELDRAFIEKFKNLFKKYEPQEGNLLQIFIPKDVINTYVYLSQAYGRLLSMPMIHHAAIPLKPVVIRKDGKTDVLDLKTIDAQTYLALFRNHPEDISAYDMDRMQGRLLITNDFLLNPESGVKIYRYNTIPLKEALQYKKELSRLIGQALDEREKALSKSQLSTNDKKLFKAIASDDTATVLKVLDEGGINFDAKNEYGHTALEVAKSRDNEEIREIVRFYRGYTLHNERLMGAALLWALAHPDGRSDLAEFFINKMPNVNIQLSDGSTPLLEAMSSVNIPIIEVLLKKGADVYYPDEFGDTPVEHAKKWGTLNEIKKLLNEYAKHQKKS